MMAQVAFTTLETPLVESEARRRVMSVEEFIRDSTLVRVQQPLSNAERNQIIIQLRTLHWPMKAIAERVGCTITTVQRVVDIFEGRA